MPDSALSLTLNLRSVRYVWKCNIHNQWDTGDSTLASLWIKNQWDMADNALASLCIHNHWDIPCSALALLFSHYQWDMLDTALASLFKSSFPTIVETVSEWGRDVPYWSKDRAHIFRGCTWKILRYNGRCNIVGTSSGVILLTSNDPLFPSTMIGQAVCLSAVERYFCTEK